MACKVVWPLGCESDVGVTNNFHQAHIDAVCMVIGNEVLMAVELISLRPGVLGGCQWGCHRWRQVIEGVTMDVG
jgi:hypothetical protein